MAIQAWWGLALLELGNLHILAAIFEMSLHPLDEDVIAEIDLLVQLLPDTLLADPFAHKSLVRTPRLTLLGRERRQQELRAQPDGTTLQSRGGAVPTPNPIVRIYHHSRPYRIQDDVPGQLLHVAVGIDQDALVPPLEQVTTAYTRH